MNGPILAALTQSFLDAINAGAVPTIATSWQVLKNVKPFWFSMSKFFLLDHVQEISVILAYVG